MKRIHLLHVVEPADVFESLIQAASNVALRIGWLDYATLEPPQSLASAITAGAFRAVSAGGRTTIAAKTRRGPARERDLIREYFRGCRLVLVAGDTTAPLLRTRELGWVVVPADGRELEFTTASLIEALRRPDLFSSLNPGSQ